MKQEALNQSSSEKRTPAPSFVKLAMKNMVRQGSKSLIHFGLTAITLIGFILLLAVLAKPSIPN